MRFKNCIEEIIAATTYLDLFLRTINEPTLLKIFLKFILFSKFDEKVTLLDTLINRINTNSKVGREFLFYKAFILIFLKFRILVVHCNFNAFLHND